MRVLSESLMGAKLLELVPRHDERGFFARAFCRDTLAGLGIDAVVAQANMSHSRCRGTLRGLHYQLEPSAETKLVMCILGAVHDVVLDLRSASPTFGRWIGVELSAENRRVMVVPPGCAHGFLTMSDDASVFYLVSSNYDPERERGVRFDDPTFAVGWPFAPTVVSDRDRHHPSFDPGWHLAA